MDFWYVYSTDTQAAYLQVVQHPWSIPKYVYSKGVQASYFEGCFRRPRRQNNKANTRKPACAHNQYVFCFIYPVISG